MVCDVAACVLVGFDTTDGVGGMCWKPATAGSGGAVIGCDAIVVSEDRSGRHETWVPEVIPVAYAASQAVAETGGSYRLDS